MTTESPQPSLDLDLSRYLADRYDAVVGQCYYNCHRIVRRSRRAAMKGATYTEGFCVEHTYGLAFEHAWITMASGVIVEPTLIKLASIKPETLAYFPAFHFPRVELGSWPDLPLHLSLRLHRTTTWAVARRSAYEAAGYSALAKLMDASERVIETTL